MEGNISLGRNTNATRQALRIKSSFPMAALVSWYDVLQVPRDARAEDIKAAYHALLLRLHPDKRGALSSDTQQQQQQGQHDKQQFHLVQLAWKVGSVGCTPPVTANIHAPTHGEGDPGASSKRESADVREV